ncbi:hypothetical protein IQ26_05803 [Mesorhizobium tianshanense]|uniref:Uncharacterized protein n=1 Tax=Mesorhizobium tianshanense TaxID=39844 RepID=A0A562N3U2_9HYPH|nr:hypothetical protein IQ26_05803 [Mesorhizobium tianshanense]
MTMMRDLRSHKSVVLVNGEKVCNERSVLRDGGALFVRDAN